MGTAPGVAVNDRDAIDIADALSMLDVAAKAPDGSRWVAALLQGMRQGECLGLTWDALDLKAGTADVSWQLQPPSYIAGRKGPLRMPDGFEYRQLDGALCLVRPKTAKGKRIIALVPWMVDALTEWRKQCPPSPHGLVWPRPDGRPQTSPTDRAAWHALQDAAQVARMDDGAGRRYELHEARHTTATLLLEAGVDTEVVRAILGHSSVITSRGYQHVSTALARAALDGLAQTLNQTGSHVVKIVEPLA
jgi:integrase